MSGTNSQYRNVDAPRSLSREEKAAMSNKLTEDEIAAQLAWAYCYTEHGAKVHITRGKALTLCGHPAWGYGPERVIPRDICESCKEKDVYWSRT